MVSISNALNAGDAQQYHQKDYANKEQAYYTQNQEVTGQWQGKLAEKMGLTGAVTAEQFQRISEGFHPQTGEALVQHKNTREGAESKTAEHRAGWDATFSAPKSVSLTAIVGEDHRVRTAHREAVTAALNEMERYVHARMGGNLPTQNTGKWAVAKFEHDSSRPVDGYAAPQLHTHAFFFNATQTPDGKTRALNPQAIFTAQSVGTSVYQAELTYRLSRMGYQFESGKSGAPEMKGYNAEYLAFQSARSKQIQDHLETNDVEGKEAAKIAARATRENKQALPPEQQRAMNAHVAARFGNQERAVMAAAQNNTHDVVRTASEDAGAAQRAVTFATRKVFERESHVTEGVLLREALNRAVGQVRFEDLRRDIDRRIQSGELVSIESNRPGHVPSYTSSELIRLERANLQMLHEGQEQKAPIVGPHELPAIADRYGNLNENQRAAVEQTVLSRDQISAIQGSAGTGKTTSLAALRTIAEERGYVVEGFAPTSRAAQQLSAAGIENSTLQKHLARGEQPDTGEKRLYFLDESSLASTRQLNEFLSRLHSQDRVVLIGDIRQHQAVDAGTPFQQLQAGGMQTAILDKIVRQSNRDLKETVEHLVKGNTDAAFGKLEAAGAIHEIRSASERKQQLANDYVNRTGHVLVVAPDNQSRYELNALIHQEMQKAGRVATDEHAVTIRIARQDLTGADREWAAKYRMGDEIRFGKGSAKLGFERGAYVTVTAIDSAKNELAVQGADGSERTYDPQRLKGVTVYRSEERSFCTGDRVQFTAPQKELAAVHTEGREERITHGVANREGGTIAAIDTAMDELRIRLDSGGMVRVSAKEKQHLDLGYAVTSHSSQGQTSDAVLVYADNAKTNPALINERLFYVAISRARESAEIYTDNSAQLKEALGREVSKTSALSEREVHSMQQTPLDREAAANSHLTFEAVVRNYAQRFAQASVTYAAATGVSEYAQAPQPEQDQTHKIQSDYVPGKLSEQEHVIQSEIDRTPLNQDSDINQESEINAYPEMEISL